MRLVRQPPIKGSFFPIESVAPKPAELILFLNLPRILSMRTRVGEMGVWLASPPQTGLFLLWRIVTL